MPVVWSEDTEGIKGVVVCDCPYTGRFVRVTPRLKGETKYWIEMLMGDSWQHIPTQPSKEEATRAFECVCRLCDLLTMIEISEGACMK